MADRYHDPEARLITLQLGSGCSAAAIAGGRSLDTSMGLTPLEGLVMATRSGDVDPALPAFLEEHEGISAKEAWLVLNEDSGLKGVSGRSGDMRELLEAGDDRAGLAIDLYCYRIRKYVGSYMAVLGGADALVFGGGVGENSAEVRSRVCAGMDWCGVALDEERNARAAGEEMRIDAGGPVEVWVMLVDEAEVMARDARPCWAERRGMTKAALTEDELRRIDGWWQACNYVSVGQIYLLDNPLLRKPLGTEHVKPRLLGHLGGTSPGLAFIYAHLNRVIKKRDLNALYVTGPGHGAPAIIAGTYLEQLHRGLPHHPRRGGCASCSGSSRSRAVPKPRGPRGAGLDPRRRRAGLLAAARLRRRVRQPRPAGGLRGGRRRGGDRPAGVELALEQVPQPGPRRRRAADPAPERLQDRQPDRPVPHPARRAATCSPATATTRSSVEARRAMHQQMASTVFAVAGRIKEIQRKAREEGSTERPRWPAIVLVTPKGWTGPKEVDGLRTEGTWRSHQVPLSGVRDNPEHLKVLEDRLRSYRPEELFDEKGSLLADFAEAAPEGEQRMGSNPHANGASRCGTCSCPISATTRSTCRGGAERERGDPHPGPLPARRDQDE